MYIVTKQRQIYQHISKGSLEKKYIYTFSLFIPANIQGNNGNNNFLSE